MSVQYRQCILQKREENVLTQTVSYIPDKFAKLNKVLKLKTNGEWTDGWLVTHVGTLTDEPFDPYDAIKFHRKNTGDSLPKC